MDFAFIVAMLFFNARLWTLIARQEVANKKAMHQLELDIADVAKRIDHLQDSFNSLRFDMARTIGLNTVESFLVVQSPTLLIEVPQAKGHQTEVAS